MTFEMALPYLIETLAEGHTPALEQYITKINSYNNVELLNVVARFLEALGSTDDPSERVMSCCNIFYAAKILSERKVACDLTLHTTGDDEEDVEVAPMTLSSIKG